MVCEYSGVGRRESKKSAQPLWSTDRSSSHRAMNLDDAVAGVFNRQGQNHVLPEVKEHKNTRAWMIRGHSGVQRRGREIFDQPLWSSISSSRHAINSLRFKGARTLDKHGQSHPSSSSTWSANMGDTTAHHLLNLPNVESLPPPDYGG